MSLVMTCLLVFLCLFVSVTSNKQRNLFLFDQEIVFVRTRSFFLTRQCKRPLDDVLQYP